MWNRESTPLLPCAAGRAECEACWSCSGCRHLLHGWRCASGSPGWALTAEISWSHPPNRDLVDHVLHALVCIKIAGG